MTSHNPASTPACASFAASCGTRPYRVSLLLGIDLGERRIGVALGDPRTGHARPLRDPRPPRRRDRRRGARAARRRARRGGAGRRPAARRSTAPKDLRPRAPGPGRPRWRPWSGCRSPGRTSDTPARTPRRASGRPPWPGGWRAVAGGPARLSRPGRPRGGDRHPPGGAGRATCRGAWQRGGARDLDRPGDPTLTEPSPCPWPAPGQRQQPRAAGPQAGAPARPLARPGVPGPADGRSSSSAASCSSGPRLRDAAYDLAQVQPAGHAPAVRAGRSCGSGWATSLDHAARHRADPGQVHGRGWRDAWARSAAPWRPGPASLEPLAFTYLAVTQGVDDKLQIGTSTSTRAMTPQQIVDRLQSAARPGHADDRAEPPKPGLRLEQIAAYLQTQVGAGDSTGGRSTSS